MSKSNSITDLFYWKWNTEFYNSVSSRQIYEAKPLLQKLNEVLFFMKLEADVLPSYNFWVLVQQTLQTFPKPKSEVFFESACEKFAASEEDYLRERLLDVLLCFKNFPQVFIDLYCFYPKFNLKFEELEFIYLDFWSQTPKVLASLLSELLVRDAPLQEVFTTDFKWYAWGEAAYPFLPAERTKFTQTQLHNLMIDYFVEGERGPIFVEIINLYLKARPQILAECTKDLLDDGNVVNDDSLAQYFVGYYIFKGATLEALGFCVANADNYFDPFKNSREAAITEWESFTEEERKEIIKRTQKFVEEESIRIASDAMMTHEEKVARVEARDAAWEKQRLEAEAYIAANPDWREKQE